MNNDAEQHEHDMWYIMTQQRLAKLGLDVGVPYTGDQSALPESVFEFSCPERYKHDITHFTADARERGEVTEDLIDALHSVWENDGGWLEDPDEFSAEMIRLCDIADKADESIQEDIQHKFG